MAKRLRQEDFPIPKRISEADWAALCESIPRKHQQLLKMRLDEMVDGLVAWMRHERTSPDRKSDRDRIEEAHLNIQRAVAGINGLGPTGHMVFGAVSSFLAPMLAAQWMHESFPNDDWAPRKSPMPDEAPGCRKGVRPSIRARFVGHVPVKTTAAALKEIEKGLTEVLRAFDRLARSKGGQKPLIYRHYAICHLIAMWVEIGEKPLSTPDSDFAAFCESVAGYIGWPSEGMVSAIPAAMKHWKGTSLAFREYWRHLPRKINR